jgi:hypothetical protein
MPFSSSYSLRTVFLAGAGVSLLAAAGALVACGSSDARTAETTDNGGVPPGGTLGGPGTASGKPCAPNKANFDIPGNGCDDDADGTVDNPPTCDDGLTNKAGDGETVARAIGICSDASTKGYGLVNATITRGYARTDKPAPEQTGILPKFGNVIKPRQGSQLAVLSTGYAQEFNGSPGAPFGGTTGNTQNTFKALGKEWFKTTVNPLDPLNSPGTGTLPPGFPKPADGCKQSSSANDVVDVKLILKAPPNASGIQFDFNFYSGEWPAYICSPFNDGFIAFLSAKGFNGGTPDNISFDAKKNPVSVNNGFFDRCTAKAKTGCADGAKPGVSECPGGTSELAGTGFGIEGNWCSSFGDNSARSVNGGATGWLTSKAPVQPGETFTLEFFIWDTGDGVLDSSVLLDNFQWVEGEVQTSTERPR